MHGGYLCISITFQKGSLKEKLTALSYTKHQRFIEELLLGHNFHPPPLIYNLSLFSLVNNTHTPFFCLLFLPKLSSWQETAIFPLWGDLMHSQLHPKQRPTPCILLLNLMLLSDLRKDLRPTVILLNLNVRTTEQSTIFNTAYSISYPRLESSGQVGKKRTKKEDKGERKK